MLASVTLFLCFVRFAMPDSSHRHHVVHQLVENCKQFSAGANQLTSKFRDVLIIGDSIDRFIKDDWCEHVNGNVTRWAASWYNYDGLNATRCMDEHTNSSLSQIHVYGSEEVGPYYWPSLMQMQDPASPYYTTKDRIRMAVTTYKEEFGRNPTMIIFHSAVWDWHNYAKPVYRKVGEWPTSVYYERGNQVWNETIVKFRDNVLSRIADIKAFVKSIQEPGEVIGVGLRTAVWYHRAGELLREFNIIIRELAYRNELYLLDYDYEVWQTVNFNYQYPHEKMFRDTIHPHAFYSILAANKLLSLDKLFC